MPLRSLYKGGVSLGHVIACRELSKSIRKSLADKARKNLMRPGLAVILVGDDPASQVYVRNKQKACEEVGFFSTVHHMSVQDVSTDGVICLVKQYAARADIHGILVQLPLPAHIDAARVIAAIPPEKDVDALTPANMGRLALGDYLFAPCTPTGIMHILHHVCGSVSGANCAVIGRSNIVGKPMAAMLTQENATVTLCHSHTENLADITSRADILISSVGKTNFVTPDMVKQDAIVIDVGINRRADGKLEGDVCFEEVLQKADMVTPVPGGVGVMTVTALLENTYKAAMAANKQ